MADETGLDLVIKANADSVNTVLKTVQQNLAQTAAAALKVDSSFDKLTTSTTALQRQVTAFGGGVRNFNRPLLTLNDTLLATPRAFNAASTAVQRSTRDFTGLSRIIQDLPFGFIGIQNNLTQLLPAAGGLGLAISAIVSAVTFAQVGFSAWTRGLSSNKEQLDAQAEAMERSKAELASFNDGLKSAEAGAISQGVSLKAFVAIARDTTKSLEERNYALEQANKILGEHGEKLTLVNINTAATTAEIEKFTQALISQALAAKFADRIADLIVKQKDQLIDYKKALEDVNSAREKVRIPGGEDVFKLYDKLKEAYGKQNTTAQAYNETLGELKLRMNQFADTQKTAASLFGEIGTKAKTSGKDIKTVNDVLDGLNKTFELIGKRETLFDVNLNDERIKASLKAINELFELGLDPGDALVQNILKGTEDLEKLLPVRIKSLNEKIQDSINDLKVKITVDPGPLRTVESLPIFQALKKLEEEANLDKLNAKIKNTSDLLTGTLGPAFDAAFSAIANGENAFEAVGESLKNLVIQIISAAIKAAVFSLIIKSITGGSASFGSIFSGLFGKLSGLPAFASGGIVTGPTVGLIGEAGKEAVIPLDRLNDFLRPVGGPTDVRISGALRGQTIFLQQDRVRRSNNRNK